MSGSPSRKAQRLLICVGIAVVMLAQPTFAYLKFGVQVGTQTVIVKWSQVPVRYFISDGSVVPGVGGSDLQAAVARAFATWQAVPSASISYQFAGTTTARPLDDDGLSTIGFRSRPDLDRVLASTHFLLDSSTGAIVEADIFFNSAFQWSVAANGEANKFDLESVALHEIGHLSGLGHSALGETVLRPDGGRTVTASDAIMFPIALGAGSVAARTLRADDIAGISDIYPDGGFTAETGSISGRVTKNGVGLFGAHIVAFNLATGALVASFSLTNQGEFSIGGLTPGPHIIRVEPLDDADIDGFFDATTPVDLNFRVRFYDRLVVAPRGHDSGTIEVKVAPK
ncbi:MAG TPA: matrixin family metalloprotease [Vicinamibacterales bacterium]